MVFDAYHRMRSKGKTWAGTRHNSCFSVCMIFFVFVSLSASLILLFCSIIMKILCGLFLLVIVSLIYFSNCVKQRTPDYNKLHFSVSFILKTPSSHFYMFFILLHCVVI